MSKPIVNETIVKIFSSADYKDAEKRYGKFADASKCTYKRGKTTIAVYFNDDEDTYKVTIIGGFGDVIEKDVYSWDELSQLVHDNI